MSKKRKAPDKRGTPKTDTQEAPPVWTAPHTPVAYASHAKWIADNIDLDQLTPERREAFQVFQEHAKNAFALLPTCHPWSAFGAGVCVGMMLAAATTADVMKRARVDIESKWKGGGAQRRKTKQRRAEIMAEWNKQKAASPEAKIETIDRRVAEKFDCDERTVQNARRPAKKGKNEGSAN